MANYTQLLTAFKTSVNQRITSKNTTDSIDPVDVGGSITDFADTILGALNSINQFNILGGVLAPTQGQGNEDDVYIQYGTTLTFWKKDNNSWVSKVNASFGINIPDGNINLQYRVAGMVVTVSSGTWYIDNIQYQKPVQTQFTIPDADLNFDRIDAVFADKTNNIHYVSGTASADPDNTKPITPNDEIIVTYIYVPKSSSGQLPYIADSNFSDNGFPIFTSGAENPLNSNGIDGDIYVQIPVDNSFQRVWQKLAGNWQVVFNIPLINADGYLQLTGGTRTIDPIEIQGDVDEDALTVTGGADIVLQAPIDDPNNPGDVKFKDASGNVVGIFYVPTLDGGLTNSKQPWFQESGPGTGYMIYTTKTLDPLLENIRGQISKYTASYAPTTLRTVTFTELVDKSVVPVRLWVDKESYLTIAETASLEDKTFSYNSVTGVATVAFDLYSNCQLEYTDAVQNAATNNKPIPPYSTYTALKAYKPRPDGMYRVNSDDSPRGDGTPSFFISFNNTLNYLLTIEQED